MNILNLYVHERYTEKYADVRQLYDALFLNGAVIAGGAAVHFLSMEFEKVLKYPLNDIDIFFIKSGENEINVQGFCDSISYLYDEQDSSPTGLVRNFKSKIIGKPKLQVITREYKSTEDLFKSFDCTLSCVTFDGKQLSYLDKTYYSLSDRIIDITNPSRSFNTIQRLIKFEKLGFDVKRGIGQVLYYVASNAAINKIVDEALLEYCMLGEEIAATQPPNEIPTELILPA